MNNIKKLLIAGIFVSVSTVALAANSARTNMDNNWICKTNASSASTDADKMADDKMAKNATSASDAFNYASTNCRDCTKITCELQNN